MKRKLLAILIIVFSLTLSSCGIELSNVRINRENIQTLLVGENKSPGYEIEFLLGSENVTVEYRENDLKVISPNDISESKQKRILNGFNDYRCTWMSEDESVATVDEFGVIQGVGPGETVIYFSCGDKDKIVFNDSMSVTVHKTVESISVTKNISLTEGSSSQLKVSVLPENASNKNIEYISGNNKIITVDKDGKIKAIGKGKTEIKIKSLDNFSDVEAVVVVTVDPKPIPKPEESTPGSFEEELLKLVNEARSAAGLSPLKLKKSLNNSSLIRAKELPTSFSHQRPDGRSWSTVDKDARAENIAAGYSSAKDVFKAWMNSSGHKANIMNPKYKVMGVGYYRGGGRYTHYWCQLFGT